ncbi:alpha/beta hydrolase [Actinomadura sp. GC306]|uniref:alpha/beta hydrolase n=1 Tax=Actinomadura sp. GC306 TaxID=2530367 RepID=UPI001050EBFE|nr:alpha/beta hydrolase [Actinomadura sp. GC306]TDC70238.1 alpha/beta hydrolase [Actinomadura sp. GC306]
MRPVRVVRTLAAAGAAALALTALGPVAPAQAAVTRVQTTVEIRCAFTTLNQNADWYFPSGSPQGLVWLQHGFARSNGNVADLASKYATAGYLVFAPSLPSANLFGCTLQNIGNNTDFLGNVADLFAKMGDPNDKLGRSFTKAKTQAGRPGLTLPGSLVLSGHSAGGEAVSYVAGRLRTDSAAGWARVRGLVLLDPVKSFLGSNLDTGLRAVDGTGRMVRTISAPDGTCNNSGSGTDAVQARMHAPFVGVRLTGGAHTDAEGASTDTVGTIACGTPKAENIAVLQTFAVAWATDAFRGTQTAAYLPGGSYYQAQLGAGRIQTLTGAS